VSVSRLGPLTLVFLAHNLPALAIQPVPATIQPSISTIQCFPLNNLIPACYSLPCTPSPSADRPLFLIRHPLRNLYSRRLSCLPRTSRGSCWDDALGLPGALEFSFSIRPPHSLKSSLYLQRLWASPQVLQTKDLRPG